MDGDTKILGVSDVEVERICRFFNGAEEKGRVLSHKNVATTGFGTWFEFDSQPCRNTLGRSSEALAA